jgi:sec-independent protein translocase protein TatB
MDLGIGTSELILIAAVALIVVGPKDLPLLMRKVGQFMNKMRGLAAEFRASFDEMARQSELDELRKEVEALRQGRIAEDVRADIEGSFAGAERDLYAPPAMEKVPWVDPADEAEAQADLEPELPFGIEADEAEPELPFDEPLRDAEPALEPVREPASRA